MTTEKLFIFYETDGQERRLTRDELEAEIERQEELYRSVQHRLIKLRSILAASETEEVEQ